MDLRTGRYYWLNDDKEFKPYPQLAANERTEILIVGGGISGAMLAYRLTTAGYGCIVIDKKEIGMGSTVASTSILQYEIDVPLKELIEKIGAKDATYAYELCNKAIYDFEALVRELNTDVGFFKKNSLYLAKDQSSVPLLKEEYRLRKNLGIDLEYLDSSEIQKHFSFESPSALYSKNSAVADPYLLTHALFKSAKDRGVKIYGKSSLVDYLFTNSPASGRVKLKVRGKNKEIFEIHTNHVIFCTGYETQNLLKEEIVDLVSTYSIATEEIKDFTGWNDKCTIWETGYPYTYIRTVNEKRAMIGGNDLPFKNAFLRDLLIPFISGRLIRKLNRMFPDIKARKEFSWAGTFGKTKDGLPYIGKSTEYEGAYFALGFGGNGMTFSLIASDMVFDYLKGKPNRAFEIFRFGR